MIHTRSLDLVSPTQTAEFAQKLGSYLKGGDVLLLSGEIGAGKTVFARALIQSLQDVPEDVPSPSFTLVQIYETPVGEVWHSDLYRLSDPDQCVELGLTDAFETAICIVEWPDRLGDLVPDTALHLEFSLPQSETNFDSATEDTHRSLKITWKSDSWAQRVEAVM